MLHFLSGTLLVYLALDSDGKVVHELEFEDMKQALKNSDEKLHLCVVKDTKR
ncbi:hypothetical protein [Vibrio parahaemolyticus]|uniref:hypothetical protein n=1 Tax=Vibrio parahaemolyticus TaxID=670 RepID=UPI00344CAF7D